MGLRPTLRRFPALWVNGAIRYCLSDANSGADYYYSPDWWDYLTINGSTVSSSGLNFSGSYTANADGGVFVLSNSTFDLRPSDANGGLLQTSATATYGPPGVAVTGVFWKFQGTSGNADYYKGASAGQVLKFSDGATVVVNNPPTNAVNASSSFAWGVFQDLPFAVTPLNADGSVVAPPAAQQGPLAVIAAEQVWRYSSIGGTDFDTYVGSQSGQVLYVYGGNSVWVSDPYRDIDAAGTYANGTFQVLGVAVQAANLYGAPEQFTARNRQQSAAGLATITGPFDIYGNLLSLGTAREDVSRAGFNLGFTDSAPGVANSAATISLVAGRPENQWIWSHASATSSGTVPMMKLAQGNRLMLYSPVDGTPRIVFDPIGGPNFKGTVRVQRQGDLSMGEFTSGAAALIPERPSPETTSYVPEPTKRPFPAHPQPAAAGRHLRPGIPSDRRPAGLVGGARGAQ